MAEIITTNGINGMTVEFYVKTHRYKLNGVWVKPLTTILSYLGKPGISHWKDGLLEKLKNIIINLVTKNPEEIQKVYEDFLEEFMTKAKDVGSDVHLAFERMLKGIKEPIETQYPVEVGKGVEAIQKWVNTVHLESMYVEIPVGSLLYQYGCKPDFVGKVNGKTAIIEFKTSKPNTRGITSLFPENHLQLAAQWQAVKETHGIEVEELWGLRLDKDTGLPDPVQITDNPQELFSIFLGIKKAMDFCISKEAK